MTSVYIWDDWIHSVSQNSGWVLVAVNDPYIMIFWIASHINNYFNLLIIANPFGGSLWKICVRPPTPLAAWVHQIHTSRGESGSATMVMVVVRLFLLFVRSHDLWLLRRALCMYKMYGIITLKWGSWSYFLFHIGLHHTNLIYLTCPCSLGGKNRLLKSLGISTPRNYHYQAKMISLVGLSPQGLSVITYVASQDYYRDIPLTTTILE
jgi:hypothetical protein